MIHKNKTESDSKKVSKKIKDASYTLKVTLLKSNAQPPFINSQEVLTRKFSMKSHMENRCDAIITASKYVEKLKILNYSRRQYFSPIEAIQNGENMYGTEYNVDIVCNIITDDGECKTQTINLTNPCLRSFYEDLSNEYEFVKSYGLNRKAFTVKTHGGTKFFKTNHLG